MSGWTAIVPLKPGGVRKSRLAPSLASSARAALVERMAAHMLACLAATPAIDRRLLLAGDDAPALDAERAADEGGGLNAELERLAARLGGRLLVIHPDLPFVEPADIAALLAAAADAGAAIAPDRAGTGTNALALALAASRGAFAFGPDSRRAHRRALPGAATVDRAGLAFDIDTPDDLALARADPRWARYRAS